LVVSDEIFNEGPTESKKRSGIRPSDRRSLGRIVYRTVLVLCLASGLWAGFFTGGVRADTPTPDVQNGTLNGLPQADVNQIGDDVRRVFNVFFSLLGFVAAGFIAWNAVKPAFLLGL